MFRWQFLPPDCKASASAPPPSLEAAQFESSSYDAPDFIYALERKVGVWTEIFLLCLVWLMFVFFLDRARKATCS